MQAKDTWTLDQFFKGGSSSLAFAKELQALKADISKLRSKNKAGDIQTWQKINSRMRQAASFIHCLTAQDVRDEKAVKLQAQMTALQALFEIASDEFFQKLSTLKAPELKKILKEAKDSAFSIEKKLVSMQKMLPLQEEEIATSLAIDGYHGWNMLYSTLLGKMSISVSEKGKKKEVSVQQADDLLSHPKRDVRKNAFDGINKACLAQEHIFTQVLNHLAGFRIELYNKRKWESFISEPLDVNNMQEASLEAMWKVVSENKAPFVKFLNKKAKLLGLKKLSWFDVNAPIEDFKAEIPYKKACELIVKYFGKFSPKMAAFAKESFKDGTIDAQNRSTKAPGGFCTPFSVSHKSRIFMTYTGTFQNMLVLAHELGHAYHNHEVFNLPDLAQEYPMSLAECASTFAELLVLDGLLQDAKTDKEKLAILQNKAERNVMFFMNIHARFLFEKAFYEERRLGFVSTAKISDIMVQAQQEAFSDALDIYNPNFWITKLHFYFTKIPFYNFPYTVGYLFSMAVFGEAKKDPMKFDAWYSKFLQDAGRMSIEDVAQSHFGLSLSKKTFWQKAADVAIADITQFLTL
jgi:oligoendopeptidase F